MKFPLDFRYKNCEDKKLRDEMFILELKKYQNYYLCRINKEHRKEVQKSFYIQLNTVLEYLQMIREGENK